MRGPVVKCSCGATLTIVSDEGDLDLLHNGTMVSWITYEDFLGLNSKEVAEYLIKDATTFTKRHIKAMREKWDKEVFAASCGLTFKEDEEDSS